MPALVTHHIFAEEVYKRLDKKIIDKIDKERIIYQTFSQSHDYLFYYNSLNIKKTIKIIIKIKKLLKLLIEKRNILTTFFLCFFFIS